MWRRADTGNLGGGKDERRNTTPTGVTDMMPKGDTITAIMRINRSARAEFLSEFSCDDLSCYLDRLSSVWPS